MGARGYIYPALRKLPSGRVVDSQDRLIAAIAEDRERVVAEAADLLYHLLVLLHVRGIALSEVEAALAERTRQSGLDEKAARKGGD